MPYNDPQPTDPMMLVGVEVEAAPGAVDEMARCLIEEFLRQGWDEKRLLALFRNPFYLSPHLFYRARGEHAVRALIAEVAATWGIWRVSEAAGTEGAGRDG